MLETLTNCPFCKSPEIGAFIETKDYTVSRETFCLSKCINCGLIFTNPRPDPGSISKYYESEDYISHTNSRKGLFNRIYQQVRKYTISKKFRIINGFTNNNDQIALLDIGCGTGEFLNYCKQKRFDCIGIEPGDSARRLAQSYGLTVYDTPVLLTLPDSSFDVITLWHVLEHVHDLEATLKNLNRLLKPGGHCFIAVPNPTSYDAKKYGGLWAAYDVPRHLFHFSPAALKNAFNKCGFTYSASLPMKLDSYYVSLLSEKYKAGLGLITVIKSIATGFISNLKARNAEEYSSVIYVFKRT